MEQKRTSSKRAARSRVAFERKGKLEVPPVIVKGGSMNVEFPVGDFEDDTGKPIKVAKHTKNTKITVVEVRDHKKKLLNSYTLPDELKGKCFVVVWDDSP